MTPHKSRVRASLAASVGVAALPLAASALAQDRVHPPPVGRPLAFVENVGQWDSPARFIARTGPLVAHFSAGAWTIDHRPPVRAELASSEPETATACAVRFTFEGAREHARPEGDRALPGRYGFFIGSDPEAWRRDVPSYASIVYDAMYPGVDVRVRSEGSLIEYDLLLEPGADLDRVVVRCAGIDGVAIEPDGTLVLDTALGPIRQEPPTTWELDGDGAPHFVTCHYRRIDEERYGFAVPERDSKRPLVVDPGIQWSTLIGGSGNDGGLAGIVRQPNGNFVNAAFTTSPDYPTTMGAYDTTRDGSSDVSVSCISADGSTLVWSTLLGGDLAEWGFGLDVDPGTGDVIVAGSTRSATTFPMVRAEQPTFGGQSDGFVSVISSDGASLLYSSYLGGSDREGVFDVDRDPSGDITVVGTTFSTDFPTTPGAYDRTHNGDLDLFVTRLRIPATGAASKVWSTNLGGDAMDGQAPMPNAGLANLYDVHVEVEASGRTTVSGSTESTSFPTTPGAYDETHNGGTKDLFVSRLDATGSTLLASTFVGSPGLERRGALALDPTGAPVVVGWTDDPRFPTTPGAYDETHNGGQDGVLVKLDPNLTRLRYSTYFGGAGPVDRLNGVLVDSGGTVTVLGQSAGGFPVTPGAHDRLHNGGADIIVARLRTDTVRDLQYSTYVGGSAHDVGWRGHQVGNAITITGWTTSGDYPTTTGAWDETYNGGEDGYLTQLELLPRGVETLGRSSPGCSGPLFSSVNQMPQTNSPFFLMTCTGAPVASNGFLLTGLAAAQNPLQILGVEVWLAPAGWLIPLSAASDGLGYAEVGLPIPADSSLVNARLFGQFFWSSPCGPQGFSASDAIGITIQP